jgi:hypothetical protein
LLQHASGMLLMLMLQMLLPATVTAAGIQPILL